MTSASVTSTLAGMVIALVAVNLALWVLVGRSVSSVRRKVIMSTQAEIDAAIGALRAEVERQTSVEHGAVKLILGIDARVRAAIEDFKAANPGVDVSALAAVTEAIRSNSTDLSAAVAANTPAAPAPVAPEAPPTSPSTP